jgi:hypothetical protein
MNLAVFINFLENNCMIKNPFYITDKRPLNGKMRIFNELYEPKFNKNTKVKTSDALLMTNLPFPKPNNVNDHF